MDSDDEEKIDEDAGTTTSHLVVVFAAFIPTTLVCKLFVKTLTSRAPSFQAPPSLKYVAGTIFAYFGLYIFGRVRACGYE